jgi:hypothetical protein
MKINVWKTLNGFVHNRERHKLFFCVSDQHALLQHFLLWSMMVAAVTYPGINRSSEDLDTWLTEKAKLIIWINFGMVKRISPYMYNCSVALIVLYMKYLGDID